MIQSSLSLLPEAFPAEWLLWVSLVANLALAVAVAAMRRGARRREAETSKKMEEMAGEANRQKNAFVANMTHEIRTPLNAIVGFTNMLVEMGEVDGETRATFVREINTNKDSLLQIVGDLIDYSKIETGTFEYADAEVDVNALVDEVCMRENSRPHPGGVRVEFAERMGQCRLRIDRNRFTQVVGNLVRNALKFTERGGVTVGSRRQGNGDFYFYVKDTGIGIDEGSRRAVFERFVKMNYNVKGTGLGLSIAKSIVEHYGGGIGVESKKGEGSTFYFTLPARLDYKEYGKF